MRKVFIVAATRSPIGNFGGTLLGTSPAELGRAIAVGALEKVRYGASRGSLVDEVIVGNVLGAGHGMNLARQVGVKAGLPVTVPAYTVNKVCGSGLKAVTLGAQAIALGDAEAVLAGGVESMSQAPFTTIGARWGARLGHLALNDAMINDGLTDVFHGCHMGITAENLAERFQISRREQDEYAAESQRRAASAIGNGWFQDEITPIMIEQRGKDPLRFDVDEYVRGSTTVEGLGKLKPAFKKDGSVTAGNASGINDGAAFLVLMSEARVKELGLEPLAELVGWASSGVEPEVMGIGPVEAVRTVCRKTGTDLGSIDLIEANEAFAVQALAVARSLELPVERTNICGGAIALGHPIGASGARILVTLVHQLRRAKKELGLATLCVGGGQGIAAVVRAL
ncbi:MAG: acetyl-CoA acetyltransferase ThlA [Pseudomonadota bacterium]|jgi:acetyl-CoA C-acetyltransferase